MATDATGTPTALGIPKFNTSADAPSGLGGNAQMDSIDALIQANTSFKGAGIVIKGNKLVSTDANTAFSLFGDGTMKWGSGGGSALDTTLSRTSPNNLALNGALTVSSGIALDNAGLGAALYFGAAFDTLIQRDSAGYIRVTNGVNALSGYRVNGVALAATHLSNGTTGSGAIVLGTSPALAGTPTAPTPLTADNSTTLATTAYVKAQGYAPLASPALTGTPTAPTPATADNSTLLATTAYVKAQGYVSSAVASFNGRTGAVAPTSGDYTAAQVTNAADLSSASVQAFTGPVSYPSQRMKYISSSGSNPTVTPDLNTASYYKEAQISSGTITFANPLNPPGNGFAGMLIIDALNTSGGTPTVSWGAAYTAVGVGALALPASMSIGGRFTAVFVYNAVDALWRLIALN